MLALCGHRARPGSDSAQRLERAEAIHATYEAAGGDDGELWRAYRAAVDNARKADGYIGRDVDSDVVALAGPIVQIASDLVEAREYVVSHGMRAGLSEAVARRSAAEGVLRALNPNTAGREIVTCKPV